MPNIPRLVQTEDRRYVRDTSSMGLLATDRSALDRHRAGRSKSAQNAKLHHEVANLRDEVRELKDLLTDFIRRSGTLQLQ